MSSSDQSPVVNDCKYLCKHGDTKIMDEEIKRRKSREQSVEYFWFEIYCQIVRSADVWIFGGGGRLRQWRKSNCYRPWLLTKLAAPDVWQFLCVSSFKTDRNSITRNPIGELRCNLSLSPSHRWCPSILFILFLFLLFSLPIRFSFVLEIFKFKRKRG